MNSVYNRLGHKTILFFQKIPNKSKFVAAMLKTFWELVITELSSNKWVSLQVRYTFMTILEGGIND